MSLKSTEKNKSSEPHPKLSCSYWKKCNVFVLIRISLLMYDSITNYAWKKVARNITKYCEYKNQIKNLKGEEVLSHVDYSKN